MRMHDNETCLSRNTPRLYIWNSGMLFLSTFRIPFRPHRIVQERLIVCLEGSLQLHLAEDRCISARSCLLGTGLRLDKGLVDARKAIIAVFYLPPFSQDYPALKSIMKSVAPKLSIGHPLEDILIQRLLAVRDGPALSPGGAYRALRDKVIPPDLNEMVFREFDYRVLAVVRAIQDSIGENLTLSQLAEAAHLSDSRLEKLFKEQTGIPITQYRLRYRVFISIILLALGYSVTEAAMVAGFSSSAHFSRSFSAINGMTPSTTFMKPPCLETFIDDELRDTVELMTKGQPA